MGITSTNGVRIGRTRIDDLKAHFAGAMLPGTLAAILTVVFGVVTAAITLNTGLQSAMNPLQPISVLGADVQAWGLTFGGPGMALFGEGHALHGTEGAFLATAFAGAAILSALLGLVPMQGIRITGAFLLLSWSLLWVTNAARLATLERDPMLALAAFGLLIGSLACIKRLDTVLREL